jgi:hypothetical protein
MNIDVKFDGKNTIISIEVSMYKVNIKKPASEYDFWCEKLLCETDYDAFILALYTLLKPETSNDALAIRELIITGGIKPFASSFLMAEIKARMTELHKKEDKLVAELDCVISELYYLRECICKLNTQPMNLSVVKK